MIRVVYFRCRLLSNNPALIKTRDNRNMKNKIFNKKDLLALPGSKIFKKFSKEFLFLIPFIFVLTSCKKEDNLGDVENIPGLGGDTWVKGPIDAWLYDSL